MWPYWIGFEGIQDHGGPHLAICGHIGYRDLKSVFSRDTKRCIIQDQTGPYVAILGGVHIIRFIMP